MLFQIKTINGQKTIVPLTADTGSGNPVGTIIPMYKKSSPSGYLYCDGSTFDANAYPLLYAYLGTNVLPDYREFALVGAEENTTDVYNASTNPTGTIHDHDVYTEGQAKDDQLQDHNHVIGNTYSGTYTNQGNVIYSDYGAVYGTAQGGYVGTGRKGTVTRGKRKAVYFYIKATSGLSENAQDNVINTLNEQRSYSTTEHNTGKKWIDGKDIYSKTVNCTILDFVDARTPHGISNLNEIIKIEGKSLAYNGQTRPVPFVYQGPLSWACGVVVDATDIILEAGSDFYAYHKTATITLEYTKTTD